MLNNQRVTVSWAIAVPIQTSKPFGRRRCWARLTHRSAFVVPGASAKLTIRLTRFLAYRSTPELLTVMAQLTVLKWNYNCYN